MNQIRKGWEMSKISSIYGSNQILFAAGSRKGKSRKQIEKKEVY